MNFVNVGFSSHLDADRVLTVTGVTSAPIKKSIRDARRNGNFIDLTHGKVTRSAIFSECGDGFIIATSSLAPDSVRRRLDEIKRRIDQVGQDEIRREVSQVKEDDTELKIEA